MGPQEHLLVACIEKEVPLHSLDEIQSRHPELKISFIPEPAPVPDELWETVTLLLTSRVFPPSSASAPNLKWVQLFSAGSDQLPSTDRIPAQVRVSTSSGIHTSQISEWIFTYMLQHTHDFSTVHQLRQERRWPNRAQRSELFSTPDLRGKTIGLVGYGPIARQTAALGKAFGMRALAYTSSPKTCPSSRRSRGVFQLSGIPGDPEGVLPKHFYHGMEGLHEVLQRSDFIILSLPLTASTKGLLSTQEFKLMKPQAYVINISRGGIIDQDALVEALRNHQIAGAALDVASPEPLTSDSELWSMDNVFISPHVSGFTQGYFARVVEVWEQNWKGFIDGVDDQIVNEVRRERGY